MHRSTLFTPLPKKTRNTLESIELSAKKGEIEDVAAIIDKTKGYRRTALLNAAGEYFAAYGYDQEAKLLMHLGADPRFVALGFLQNDKQVACKSCIFELPAKDQIEAYNFLLFEAARRGLKEQVDMLLVEVNGIDASKANLGYELR